MRRTMKTLMTTALILTASLFTSSVASADSTADYRNAMNPFLPTVTDWVAEALPLVRATETKPELACGDDMAELAQRGVWLSQDLVGTGQSAPAGLQGDHEALSEAMAKMVAASQSVCADAAAARQTVNGEVEQYENALRTVQNFLSGFHMERPGRTPGLPGTGN